MEVAFDFLEHALIDGQQAINVNCVPKSNNSFARHNPVDIGV
jgi:hypothetical protein